MIEIEKHIPPPPPPPPKETMPFSAMEIGDSFLAPDGRSLSARAQASQYKRRHPGWDYASRTFPEGLRIWRTA